MGTDYMNGWDAMVATSQHNINQAMLLAYNANELPHSASGQFTITLFGTNIPVSVDALLGPWSLSGGSGKLVIVSIPFTGGTMTIGPTTYPLQGVILNVTCLLTQIQSPVKPVSGTDYIIQIDFLSPEAIVAVQVTNVPPGLDQSTIDIVMLNFLKSTLGGHTYDIATVNLGGLMPDYSYMVPSLFEYAVDTNSTDPNSSTFGIQMLTINKTPGNQDIVPGTIPIGSPTCDTAILLSNELFTKNLILPGIASAMKIDPTQLTTTFAGGAWSVVNAGDISLSMNGYNPIITSFNAGIDNNLLTVHIIGHVEASPGITINFTIDATYKMTVTTNGAEQDLNLVQVSQNTSNTVDVATWVIITASALAALVLAVLGPIAAAIVAGIEALIIYLVATIANNEAGQMIASSLPTQLANTVKWNYMEFFTIGQALMPTPLQLGGTVPLLAPHTGVVSYPIQAGQALGSVWNVVANPSGPAVSAGDGFLHYAVTKQPADNQWLNVSANTTLYTDEGCLIAFRVRANTIQGSEVKFTVSGDAILRFTDGGQTVKWQSYDASSSQFNDLAASAIRADGSWHQLLLSLTANTLTLFEDGTHLFSWDHQIGATVNPVFDMQVYQNGVDLSFDVGDIYALPPTLATSNGTAWDYTFPNNTPLPTTQASFRSDGGIPVSYANNSVRFAALPMTQTNSVTFMDMQNAGPANSIFQYLLRVNASGGHETKITLPGDNVLRLLNDGTVANWQLYDTKGVFETLAPSSILAGQQNFSLITLVTTANQISLLENGVFKFARTYTNAATSWKPGIAVQHLDQATNISVDLHGIRTLPSTKS